MSYREQLLHDWLCQVASPHPVELHAMTNDASFRRYFRATWDGKCYVAMDAPPDKENLAAFIDVAQRLGKAGLNAPQILAKNLQAGFLLLTDLGDDLYLPVLQQGKAERVEQLYSAALEALATMQAQISCAGLPLYDKALLHREMQLFPDWLLQEHLHLSLSDAEQEMLQSCFAQLSACALAQPQVFVHRDYHSRNLLIHRNNPGIIDFQDAVCGAVTYDLVSLLRDAYIVWPPAQVKHWVLAYQQRALQKGIITEQDEQVFLRWFDWMGLQRHLKVAGIFARLYHRDGKQGYLADIPGVLGYIIDIAQQYSAMQPLHEFIVRRVKF